MAGGSNPNPITVVGDHSGETSGVHGVGASTVESVDGAQSKADAAESAAKTYADDNRYTDADASAAAPVQSVDGKTGDVTTEGGLWTEDPNSPVTATDASSVSLSLADRYDLVKLVVTVSTPSQVDISVQINNTTESEYYVRLNDGSSDIQLDSFTPMDRSRTGSHEMLLSGRWSDIGQVKISGARPRGDSPSVVNSGSIDADVIGSPYELTDVSVFDPGGTNTDWTLEVYGRSA